LASSGQKIDDIACGKGPWFYTTDRRIYKNTGSARSFKFQYVGNPSGTKQRA